MQLNEQGETEVVSQTECYHCGETCKSGNVTLDGKNFCCEGCKLVYDLLKENSLCTYYNMNLAPGISPGKTHFPGKYEHLDLAEVSEKLIRFRDEKQAYIVWYIPGIHCSSCIWLLENLHKLNQGVISSEVNFTRKEVSVRFDPRVIKLSEMAGLLDYIGYAPLITLDDMETQAGSSSRKSQVGRIGLAGFCFGNIMMLSFPEYFSFGNFYEQKNLPYFFSYINLLLSLPVFFYSASGFFISAWKSIRHRYLNIDAPIAMAILVTFLRSMYEIITHTGAGYLDSMSGIVFFMLIGRYFQDKTYETLSFERNYKSYFPMGISLKGKDGKESRQAVSQLKKGDIMMVRNQELVPADSILLSPSAHIDYSFITGESAYVKKLAGDMVHAGGLQVDGVVELEVLKPVSQSYLTQLWNQDTQTKRESGQTKNYLDRINRYFTMAVLLIAAVSALYWARQDAGKALDALTAVLIVACPCGLLLTSTFAHGNILRILGRNKLYLKNAGVIDKLSIADTIVFDKTGTITHGSSVEFEGSPLTDHEMQMVVSLAGQSSHPLSRRIYSRFSKGEMLSVSEFEDIPGHGLKGRIDGRYLILGSAYFVTGSSSTGQQNSTRVFLMLDGTVKGCFTFVNTYREGLGRLVKDLSGDFDLQLLSGDNDAERPYIENILGKKDGVLFGQKPEEKMDYIRRLQSTGHKVIMIGDGLNDAGALMQSDVGIAVSDDTNNFSPACDAIIDGSSFSRLPVFISMARAGKRVILFTFFVSLSYNIIGLSFAVQGLLSPVVAAILMPLSSITIVVLVTSLTNAIARLKKL
jgi:Cu+-exporting ATPase